MDKKSEYIILYEELRQHIRNGEIPPGNKLPSERAFMETYHLSRTTVRSALALLERIPPEVLDEFRKPKAARREAHLKEGGIA